MVHISVCIMLMVLVYRAEAYYKEKHRCLSVATKGTGLEVNGDKAKYMVMS